MVNHEYHTKLTPPVIRWHYAFLCTCFALRISGSLSDHGSRLSRNERSVSSICSISFVSRYSIYLKGFRLFAFAVSVMLYIIALAFAPSIVSITFNAGL